MTHKIGAITKFLKGRGRQQIVMVTIGLLVLCLAFGILSPTFSSGRNIENLLRQIAPILLIGIGQAYVMITGNIDLSIGSVVGMSGMIVATLVTHGWNVWIATILTLIICVLTGVLNGILVAKINIPPFIATLGTMTIARGVAQTVNNNYNTDSIGEAAKGFQDFFYYGRFLGIYSAVWIAIILFVIFAFILSKTKLGRQTYAVGSNIEASKLSGVNTVSVVVKAYVVSAFCAGIVGLMICATAGIGTMDAGTTYEMYAIAAAVIGGVSTLGGQGILFGTVIGASIWGVLQNGLQFVGAPVGLRNIAVGIIVIASVMLDIVVRMGKRTPKTIKDTSN
jgi:ribose transport system permease protein